MKDVVKILGGRSKEPGLIYELRGIISVLLLLAFIVASPFAFNAVRGVGNEKTTVITVSSPDSGENTCTVPETTVLVLENIATTTTPVIESTAVVEKESKTTTEKPVTVTTTRRETTTVRVETTQKQTSAIAEETMKVTTTRKPAVTTTGVTTESPTTTTRPVTTESIIPKIKVTPINNGNSVKLVIETYPVGGELSCVCSSSRNAVRVEGNTVIPQNEGAALIVIYYTYGDLRVGDTLCVTVGVDWSEPYKTEVKEETNSLKILVSQQEEYQLYRWVCSSCLYRDCYANTYNTSCKDSYPQGSCNGRFTILETKWFSGINPNKLNSHSFVGIKSILESDGKEWYWTGLSYNKAKTVYEYKIGTYYIESIT